MPRSRHQLPFQITPQPDDETCGPACLHAIYRYYGRDVSLNRIIKEVDRLPEGGTLAVHLARHALTRGFDATIYTCDLQTFDPTWFRPGAGAISERLQAQLNRKQDRKLRFATQAYIDFVNGGGALRMEDITPQLVESLLAQGTPLIAGLSATWLYRCARERPIDNQPDDVAGEPTGHFVVVHGIDPENDHMKIADPWGASPYVADHLYEVEIHRLIAAILLGIVTYDAKLLVIQPKKEAAA